MDHEETSTLCTVSAGPAGAGHLPQLRPSQGHRAGPSTRPPPSGPEWRLGHRPSLPAGAGHRDGHSRRSRKAAGEGLGQPQGRRSSAPAAKGNPGYRAPELGREGPPLPLAIDTSAEKGRAHAAQPRHRLQVPRPPAPDLPQTYSASARASAPLHCAKRQNPVGMLPPTRHSAPGRSSSSIHQSWERDLVTS